MIGADGMTLDRQGRLVLATFGGRSLMRIEHNGKRTILADKWEGKRFGGPNDVVVRSDGSLSDEALKAAITKSFSGQKIEVLTRAEITAESPDAQRRFRVTPGTVSGSPASRAETDGG